MRKTNKQDYFRIIHLKLSFCLRSASQENQTANSFHGKSICQDWQDGNDLIKCCCVAQNVETLWITKFFKNIPQTSLKMSFLWKRLRKQVFHKTSRFKRLKNNDECHLFEKFIPIIVNLFY